MRRSPARAVAFVLSLGVALATSAAPASPPDDAARATMQRVFAAVSVLLPEAARDDGFSDPARQQELSEAFATLRGAAGDLRRHSARRDASFRLHSRGLADDALAASAAFEAGNADEARFAFTQLTQRCVDCHARLPDLEDSSLAAHLVGLPEVQSLEPMERARYDVALRRFDDALVLWEAAFADSSLPPVHLDLEGTLADYLTIAVRVKGEGERPRRALAALARRADTPAYLRMRLVTWDVSLQRVGPRLAQSPPSLADARAFAVMARNLAEMPTARDGLVYDLAASSLLLRWIDDRSQQTPVGEDLELAAAYYELGVIEERTAYSFWIPQTDAYMEAALRAAPHGPHARRAYARVEEQLLLDYGATTPAALPAPERTRLERLVALMASPEAPAKPAKP